MDIEQFLEAKSPQLSNLNLTMEEKKKRPKSAFKRLNMKQSMLEKYTEKIATQKLNGQATSFSQGQNQNEFLRKSQQIQRGWSINSKQYKKSDTIENSIDFTTTKSKYKGKKQKKLKGNIDQWFLSSTKQIVNQLQKLSIRNLQYQNQRDSFSLRKIRTYARSRDSSFSKSFVETPITSSQRKGKTKQILNSMSSKNGVKQQDEEISKELFKKEDDFNKYVHKLSNYAYDNNLVSKEVKTLKKDQTKIVHQRPYSAFQVPKKKIQFKIPKAATYQHNLKNKKGLNHHQDDQRILNKRGQQNLSQYLHARKNSIRYLDIMENPFNRYQRQKYLQLLQEIQNSQDVSILWELFLFYDRDKDGIITKEDIKKTIFFMENRIIEEKEVQAIMSILDVDRSGGVQFEEFKNILLINKRN